MSATLYHARSGNSFRAAMRRALLEQTGDFPHVLDWADKVNQYPAVARAIDYAAVELPA